MNACPQVASDETKSGAETSDAWVTTTLGELRELTPDAVVGRLTTAAAMAGFESQHADAAIAWHEQLAVLKRVAVELVSSVPAAASWTVLLEYSIPRRAKRIDVVLIATHIVIVMEFKVGAAQFKRPHLWQAQDYALELTDFHESSSLCPIEAVLVATAATSNKTPIDRDTNTKVCKATEATLAGTILALVRLHDCEGRGVIDAHKWATAGYRPTPTIVEAARRVFAGHNVRELSHSYADNLTKTTDAIGAAIADAMAGQRRAVCFVTGVPGSGKTLAGLTAMQDARTLALGAGAASFMSGNGPLVRVLREALVRDQTAFGSTRAAAVRKTKLLIQNIHQFLSEYGVEKPNKIPPDHVVTFDEAQRAWHAGKLAKRHKTLNVSEPELMLSVISRLEHWSVLVALVGGGQEIHDGEAGLEEWGRALAKSTCEWDVVVSPEVIVGGASVAGHRLFSDVVPPNVRIRENYRMHLDVNVRAPRAQHLAEWVNAVVTADADAARRAVAGMTAFRMVLTRELDAAREWLRSQSTGEMRAGLLASSGALRLRPYGLEIDPNFHRKYPVERWFLDSREDFRSSHSLEVAMTEFECQGLEVDFVGLCWEHDFTISESGTRWDKARLSGSRWKEVRNEFRRNYLTNKYRVLLTRAREGMVIWVPRGDPNDPTRLPQPLDRTADFLRHCGVDLLEAS